MPAVDSTSMTEIMCMVCNAKAFEIEIQEDRVRSQVRSRIRNRVRSDEGSKRRRVG